MISQIINTISSITFTDVLTFLLTIDTLRAVIAFFGWFNPQSKFGRIIYGKYDTHVVSAALQELGYSEESSKAIVQGMKTNAKFISKNSGITENNAAEHLIAMLANYIVKSDREIQYGVESVSHSYFYIDTMEISHNEDELKRMTAIMTQLINTNRKKKPCIIATPKGGNPLFTNEVAKLNHAILVVAKGKKDKSRASGIGENTIDEFKINYEGSWPIFDGEADQSCIIVDCNTSGGSQLLSIIQDVRNLILKETQEGRSAPIQEPDEAYVLFRADLDGEDIDQKFSDANCKLFRYFDLDEETKRMLHDLKCNTQGRNVSIYYPEDRKAINNIINKLVEKKKFYYKSTTL